MFGRSTLCAILAVTLFAAGCGNTTVSNVQKHEAEKKTEVTDEPAGEKTITIFHGNDTFNAVSKAYTFTNSNDTDFTIYNEKHHKVATGKLIFSDEEGYQELTAETAEAEVEKDTSYQDKGKKHMVLYNSFTAEEVDKGNKNAPVLLKASGKDIDHTSITFIVQYGTTANLKVKIDDAYDYPELRDNVNLVLNREMPELPYIPGLDESAIQQK